MDIYKNLKFNQLEINSRQQIAFGVDSTGKYFIKVEILKNLNKTNDIKKEYEILKYLNSKDSKTAPTAYELGNISREQLIELLPNASVLDNISKDNFKYIVQEYVPDSGDYKPADILLTMLEQKKLGVYQGDIKPTNLRFNPQNSVCYFVDYDQAIMLEEKEQNLNNLEFLDFCSDYDLKKYGFGNWLRHFSKYETSDFTSQFRDSALNLENTSIFKSQITTNTPNGIYHTIKEKDIFIDGARDVKIRGGMLDSLEFKDGERVLDIGCNSGLLSEYLYGRGCSVTGVDNDSHIVIAAKIIANILGKEISYEHLDLDDATDLDLKDYDTIMLFSVLHHTRDPVKNAKKVSQACSRIILETRLMERGKQPVNGIWKDTTHWLFNSEGELLSFCERVFEGFKLKRNLGKCDKNRFIFEFVKAA